jgi:hypothetical protein
VFTMAKKIVMSQEHIIFRSDPYIMSSALVQKSFKFTLQWRAWKHRLVLINKEGQLGYGNGNDTYVSGMLNIKDCMVTYVPDDLLLAVLAPEQLNKFTGITIKCKTMDGFDTYFRLVLEIEQFENLKNAIRQVATTSAGTSYIDSLGPIPIFTSEEIQKHSKSAVMRSDASKSVMRRTISRAMKHYETENIKAATIAKRGALKCLPVLFANDLIHGSWYILFIRY